MSKVCVSLCAATVLIALVVLLSPTHAAGQGTNSTTFPGFNSSVVFPTDNSTIIGNSTNLALGGVGGGVGGGALSSLLQDLCFVHKDCETGISFRTGEYTPTVPAWYCNDRRLLIPFITPLDDCNIRLFCKFDGNAPYYNKDYESWFCDDFVPDSPTDVLDQCFIHNGCNDGPSYRTDINAWTCSDNYLPPDLNSYDQCFIHEGCGPPEDGLYPIYNIGNTAWFCSDSILYDQCLVTPQCIQSGYDLFFNVNIPDGQFDGQYRGYPGAWVCTGGSFPTTTDQIAPCLVHRGCESGAYYNYDYGVWTCLDIATNPYTLYY